MRIVKCEGCNIPEPHYKIDFFSGGGTILVLLHLAVYMTGMLTLSILLGIGLAKLFS